MSQKNECGKKVIKCAAVKRCETLRLSKVGSALKFSYYLNLLDSKPGHGACSTLHVSKLLYGMVKPSATPSVLPWDWVENEPNINQE